MIRIDRSTCGLCCLFKVRFALTNRQCKGTDNIIIPYLINSLIFSVELRVEKQYLISSYLSKLFQFKLWCSSPPLLSYKE